MADYTTKTNPAKEEAVKKLEEKFGSAEGIFFTDFAGLSVSQMNQLRSDFFEKEEVEYLVAKNTLMRIALASKGLAVADESALKGCTGVALGYSDAVSPVKILDDFAKGNKLKKPSFKGGIVEGEFLDEEKVKALKDIPPVEQLYAMIVGGMVSPLSGFVGVLNEIVRGFLGVLDAVIEKKKAEEAA